MATIGRNQAVTEFPNGLRFHGRIGWLMWLGLHLVYLIGFRNRLAVLVNWSWNYLTYDHSARTLVESTPDSARPHLDAVIGADPIRPRRAGPR